MQKYTNFYLPNSGEELSLKDSIVSNSYELGYHQDGEQDEEEKSLKISGWNDGCLESSEYRELLIDLGVADFTMNDCREYLEAHDKTINTTSLPSASQQLPSSEIQALFRHFY